MEGNVSVCFHLAHMNIHRLVCHPFVFSTLFRPLPSSPHDRQVKWAGDKHCINPVEYAEKLETSAVEKRKTDGKQSPFFHSSSMIPIFCKQLMDAVNAAYNRAAIYSIFVVKK